MSMICTSYCLYGDVSRPVWLFCLYFLLRDSSEGAGWIAAILGVIEYNQTVEPLAFLTISCSTIDAT